MKNISAIIVLFVAFSLNLYSQHSEKFIELTENVKPIDSIIKIKKYKNGKTKKTSKFLIYEYGEYIYEIASGKQQLFDKKGTLCFEQFYDNFGNLIYQKQFNSSNKLYRTIDTKEIDIKSESTVYDILNSTEKVLVESYEKEYNSNEKHGDLKLWKEGKLLNGKKAGEWKIYNFCDKTFKTKNY